MDLEAIKRANHDFYAGKILAQFPHFFLDMSLKTINISNFQILCKNCRKPMTTEISRGDKVYHCQRFGYFCKTCLHPVESDIAMFLKQLNQPMI